MGRDRTETQALSKNSANTMCRGARRPGSGGVNDVPDSQERPIPADLVRVRFLRPLRHYQPGDVALVPVARLSELLHAGIVELADPE